MSEGEKKFHEFAVKSILFKGRTDWYFCYLKSERIAHVLMVLAESSSGSLAEDVRELALAAAELPSTVAHFAAGEVEIEILLADIFSLLSAVRLAGTGGGIALENSQILAAEYELLAQKLAASAHPSPFASTEDFAVPPIEGEGGSMPALSARLSELASAAPKMIKDTSKGHTQGQPKSVQKEHNVRMARILEFVQKNKSVSIKDIAGVITDCSEKTIQRELAALIGQGLVKKVGERRWSLYLPA